MVRSKSEIEIIANKYVDMINKFIYVKQAYIFGSYAYGTPNENSDLDIAIVSPDFNYLPEAPTLKMLLRAARHIDSTIEPVALTEEEINNPLPGSVAIDIKNRGIKVNV
ncbi:MAG: nucleotidyltransferase domain-containing protein [Oligoflexia bacterium]|nr:nucleotidyltransferase domain-containing protein [Oligoflexia bacterium]